MLWWAARKAYLIFKLQSHRCKDLTWILKPIAFECLCLFRNVISTCNHLIILILIFAIHSGLREYLQLNNNYNRSQTANSQILPNQPWIVSCLPPGRFATREITNSRDFATAPCADFAFPPILYLIILRVAQISPGTSEIFGFTVKRVHRGHPSIHCNKTLSISLWPRDQEPFHREREAIKKKPPNCQMYTPK